MPARTVRGLACMRLLREGTKVRTGRVLPYLPFSCSTTLASCCHSPPLPYSACAATTGFGIGRHAAVTGHCGGMSDRPPTRQAVDRSTRAGEPFRPPVRRGPLDCQTCGAPFKSRGGLVWHRLNAHLRVSNELGNTTNEPGGARGAAPGGRRVAADGADHAAARGAALSGVDGGHDTVGAPGGATTRVGGASTDAAAPASGAAGSVGGGQQAGNDSTPCQARRVAGEDATAESAAVRAALDPTKNMSEAVKNELRALIEATRQELPDTDEPASKRRRLAAGASTEPVYTYSTVSTAIRALYENEGDWDRAEPIIERRNGWRPGRFDSFRLRAVERFALRSGGPGLSLQWLEGLYDLLDTWDGTKPGMPIDDKHKDPIRKSFKSVNAFKDGVRDDVDDAVLGAGWLKCTLVVDGESFVALFRPVLEVVLRMLKAGKRVRFWSGDDGPAPPTDARESVFDGDAFRLSESALMADKDDPNCFVLALHVFSDASQLSWSGGTFRFLTGGACVRRSSGRTKTIRSGRILLVILVKASLC